MSIKLFIKKLLTRKPKVIEVPKKQGVFILELKESHGGNKIVINNETQVCVYHNDTILYVNSGYAVACYGEQRNYVAVKDSLIKMLQNKRLKEQTPIKQGSFNNEGE